MTLGSLSGIGGGGGGGGNVDNNGGAWVVTVVPQDAVNDNVGNEVYAADSIVLNSCYSDTTDVTVTVRMVSGHTKFGSAVTANGNAVTMAYNVNGYYEGNINLTLVFVGGQADITIQHEDVNGDSHECIVYEDAGPVVTSATFVNGYPGTQTELKAGDTFDLRVQTDSDMVAIETDDLEAGSGESFAGLGPSQDETVTTTMPDRGDVVQTQACRVRAQNANGAWGPWVRTDDFGAVDGTHTVELNDIYPTVTIGAITYPGAQEALKDAETASIVMTVLNANTNVYTSPNGDLSITNPNEPANEAVGTTPKTVTRIAGNYNVTVDNFQAVANRAANDASTTSTEVVFIAHVSSTLAVTEPAARLRSGGNIGTVAQDHTITITASQLLLNAPTLVNGGAGSGTWQGAGFVSVDDIVWTRDLQVNDTDTKGIYAWGAISGTNLAGKVTVAITGDPLYELGGFVIRTMTIGAWPNREGSIGTQVSDTAKLECSNLSKDESGSLNFSYTANVANVIDQYTITEPTTNFNAAGNLWYNKDLANAVSNVGGTMDVELEETV